MTIPKPSIGCPLYRRSHFVFIIYNGFIFQQWVRHKKLHRNIRRNSDHAFHHIWSPLPGYPLDPAHPLPVSFGNVIFNYLWLFCCAFGMMSAGKSQILVLCKRNHYRCSYIGLGMLMGNHDSDYCNKSFLWFEDAFYKMK